MRLGLFLDINSAKKNAYKTLEVAVNKDFTARHYCINWDNFTDPKNAKGLKNIKCARLLGRRKRSIDR